MENAPAINYQSLLAGYIAHVSCCEGMHFLDQCPVEGLDLEMPWFSQPDDGHPIFSQAEVDELNRLFN